MTTSTHNDADSLPVADGRTVLRVAWESIERRWRLVPLLGVLLAAAGAGVVPPLALGSLVDEVSEQAGAGSSAVVWWLGAAMALSVAVGAVLTAIGTVASARVFERMLARLRERMVATALSLPQARVERAGTGDLIARAGDDVAEVSRAIPSVVPAVTGSLLTIGVTFAGMALIDARYALALLVIVPVHVVAVRWYLRTAPGIYTAERAAMSHRAQHLLDSLHGVDSVRAFGLVPLHASRIAGASWAVVRWTMRARAIQNAFFARLNAAELLGMSALLVVGFVLVEDGTGTIGGATAAMLLFLRLFGPINHLLFVVDEMQSAFASLARIVGVVTAGTPHEAAGPKPGPGPDPVTGHRDESLRIESVSHSYVEGHRVLEEVDLTVRPGETVAVVGASGAGKSTLAGIAAGVHTPEAGTVHRPGVVVLVTQEVHVFDGTLRDNLTLARPGASDLDLLGALRAVGADLLVARLPDQLGARLGTAGTPLTPAEAQQVALARVLLADPPVVILDEATAEAGSSEAGLLEEAARTVGAGRTVLVVAHRLSQAAAADRVVVMDRGRVVEHGTHAELLAAGEGYARLWSAWARES